MTRFEETALVDALSRFLNRQSGIDRYWVALSGGLDSCVLLHLVAQLHPSLPVQVLHVNHRLSPRADEWQRLCEAKARAYGFAFVAETVSVETSGQGLEKAAREARYAAFERHLRSGDMLLMAHHSDDQAETLLLRLLRGAGVRGLGAMPSSRALGAGQLGRPLLGFSREHLHAYARSQALDWVEDESNASPDFDRNYLRLKIMPALAARWPGFDQRFGETAALAREAESLLNEYAAEDLARAGRRDERLGQSIELALLTDLSYPRRNALLRHWIGTAGYSLPGQDQLARVDDVLNAAEDAEPVLCWANAEFRRFRSRLYLLPQLPDVTESARDWSPPEALALGDGGCLTAEPAAAGLRAGLQYQVRQRAGGERCQPVGRAHSQKLKKLLQEYGLEPWLRDRVPLLYAGDQLAAVGDLWVCREFHVEGEPAWEVGWSYESEGKGKSEK